jgi:hypothetical protein
MAAGAPIDCHVFSCALLISVGFAMDPASQVPFLETTDNNART